MKNPNTILIQNNFYPSGLTELDINTYYSAVKNKIININQNREVILFINTDINETIVRRYESLTKNNFSKIIHPRVISIISTMNRIESFGIIDIDYIDFEINKSIVLEIYKYLEGFSNIINIKIRFTGKTSFHIIIYFKDKQEIDNIRFYLNQTLSSKFKNKYDISSKRSLNKPNLDLSPNKFRGGFISEYSLSIIGLKCIEIPINHINSFSKQFARIKTPM